MIETILSLVTGGLGAIWGWLAAGASVLAVVLGVYAKGRADSKRAQRLRDAEANIKTRKDIDDALTNSRRDGGAWHDRLRERDK